MQQLPMGLTLRTDASFASFVCGRNDVLLRTLRELAEGHGTVSTVFLHGAAGSGRSHLLNAVAASADAAGRRVALLPMKLAGLTPDVLAGFEQCELVCVDDLDTVCADRAWAEALFHLFNAVRDRGGQLLFAADRPPALLNCGLPDLQSRLASMLVFALQELSDEDKQALLIQRGVERGLRVPVDVAQYLLSRQSRALADLLQVLDKLDHASLAEQRRLTLPFVRQVLGADELR